MRLRAASYLEAGASALVRPCPFMNSRPMKTDAIAACAEGYAFPTNLDRNPPIGGLAPQTQQQLMKKALAES